MKRLKNGMGLTFATFCTLTLSLSLAHASKLKPISISEAPVHIDKGLAKRLFIAGFSGQVTLLPLSKGSEIVVHAVKYMDGDEPANNATMEYIRQLVVRTVNYGDTVEVRAQLPPAAGEWAHWAVNKHLPQVKLEVSAPETMDVEIYLARGDVKISHWMGSVSVTSQEGGIDLENIESDVVVRSVSGHLKVDNIKGAVNIENFSSALTVGNVTGKLKLRTFSGEAKIKKITGPANVSSQKAPVYLSETTGPMEIQSGIGAIHIAEHKGALSGHSEEGSLTARVIGDPAVHLTSGSGPITLSISRGVGTNVNLLSDKGQITAPKTLESKKGESGKSVRGTLGSGSEKDGHVRLSSDSGDLVLKVL